MKQVPFSVIRAAKKFDSEAVLLVFQHFEGFISSQCLCCYDDKYGNIRHYVDDDLYYKAIIALLDAITSFQFKEPPDNFMS